MPRRRGQFLGLLTVASALAAGEAAQPRLPVAADIVDAVRASLARYQSISCRTVHVSWSDAPPPVGMRSRPPTITEVVVRRSGRGARAYTERQFRQSGRQGFTTMASCLDGTTKTCRQRENHDPEGTVSRSGFDPGDAHDPLVVLKRAGSSIPDCTRTVSLTPGGMYRLEEVREWKDGVQTIAWTVDPAREYLPVECALTEAGKAGCPPFRIGSIECVWYSNVRSYSEFVITAAGLWFPTKILAADTVERAGQGGNREVLAWGETAIEDLVLNADMPDELFQFRFPNGTRVEDEVANISYVAGTDERAIDERTDRVREPEQKGQPPAGADPAKGGPVQP